MKTFEWIYFTGLIISVIIMIIVFIRQIIDGQVLKHRDRWLYLIFLGSWLFNILALIALILNYLEENEDVKNKLVNIHRYIPIWTRYHIQSKYLLTPYATVVVNLNTSNTNIYAFKMIYIFGIRIARIHLIL